MYIENIFSAEDIIKQLPNESKQFKKVDTFWKDVMAKIHRNPSILDTCASEGIFRRFQSNKRTLEEIQKWLEDYLETKRAAFPRFYFLSNDELLQILSQTRNPQAVQPHLRKWFDNMASVEFSSERNSKSIIAMTSADEEKVSFSAPVLAEWAVEFWLSDIERMMVKSLYDKNKAWLQCYPPNALERRAWFFSHPTQLTFVPLKSPPVKYFGELYEPPIFRSQARWRYKDTDLLISTIFKMPKRRYNQIERDRSS